MIQRTIEFEPGLTDRHKSLRECVTACIYQRGLSAVAIDLDKSPGNLSRQLSGDSGHHFRIESLEDYIKTSGDLTPIYYLIARYMGDAAITEAAAMLEIRNMLGDLVARVGQIETAKKPARR